MVENAADWNNVIKKEARGNDDTDLGEVQDVGSNYVVTQKGLISKDKFFIPKYLVRGFDGDKLYFNIGETDLDKWKRDAAPTHDEYTQYRDTSSVGTETRSDIETRIPLIHEQVQKTNRPDEVVVKKEQVTEMVETPVTHEEVRVEKKPGTTKVIEEK